MSERSHHRNMHKRRGAVAVYVAASGVVLLGFAALAVDAGRLYLGKTELQVAADVALVGHCDDGIVARA